VRKLIILAAVVLVLFVAIVVAGLAFWLSRSDEVQLVTEAPLITSTTGETTAGEAALTTGGTLHFVVVPEESEATYIVREKLASLPLSSNAVGKTRAVAGDVFLTREGLATERPSVLRVDLRTLESDEGRRDNYIRQNTLQTDTFPFAEFVIDEVQGFPTDYTEGEEVELVLRGRMTIRDTQLPLSFQVKARQAGDTLTAVADTSFNMTDFGLDPPQLAFVSVEDGVQLQIVLKAQLSL
jgi:polyisoprenoid-binding protein YceI